MRLFSGSILLNAEQVAKRPDCFKKLGSGVFEIQKPVEFKTGEVIGFDKVPKTYKPLLEAIKTSASKGK